MAFYFDVCVCGGSGHLALRRALGLGDYVGGFYRDRAPRYMGGISGRKYPDFIGPKSKIMRAIWGDISGYYLTGRGSPDGISILRFLVGIPFAVMGARLGIAKAPQCVCASAKICEWGAEVS